MPIHAVLDDNGIVLQRLIYDADKTPEGFIDASEANLGDLWTEAGFVVAPENVPPIEDERAAMVASPAQIRLTLYQLGLLPTVQAIADADPQAAIVWEYAAEIRRTNALIDALAGDGFTPAQIDDIFRYAMALVI